MNRIVDILHDRHYNAILIGASAGGFSALKRIIPHLSHRWMPGVVIVVHRGTRDTDDYLESSFNATCSLTVKQADEKESIEAGTVYFAPPNYHLLIEDDLTFSLSMEGPVNYARPAIDVAFESAAEVPDAVVAGVILTGANDDGSRGLRAIKRSGGLTIVQDPSTAEVPSMPRAAVERASPDRILPLASIGPFLAALRHPKYADRS